MSDLISSDLLDSFALLSAQLRLDHLLPFVLDVTLQLTGAERAFLMLSDETGQLSVKEARCKDRRTLSEEEFRGSRTIIRKVLREKKPLYIPCLSENEEFASCESIAGQNLKSAICFPLWRCGSQTGTDAKLLGLLYIDSCLAVHPLGEQHLQLMQMLVNHVAVSIENAMLFQELEEKNRQISHLNKQLQQRVRVQAENLNEMKILFEETQRELGKAHSLGNLVGRSKPMQEVFRILERVVGTHATVLITGESGTGKELVAKYLHYNGPRAKKPMISMNCSAFSETLLESELFGHRKGAFTGADESKTGLFELADGGTMFLDEVGDMSPEMQKKLLRVLENGEVRPVGSKEVHHVDVRILAATNTNLEELAQKGKFREDLYFRLNVIHVHLPPLRERREDIPVLVDFFSRRISEELGVPHRKIPNDILAEFLRCDWPGNVRQLANELRRVFILDSKYQTTQLRFARAAAKAPEKGENGFEKLHCVEKKLMMQALEITGGNRSKAAELLGIPRRTFYDRLKKYNLGDPKKQ